MGTFVGNGAGRRIERCERGRVVTVGGYAMAACAEVVVGVRPVDRQRPIGIKVRVLVQCMPPGQGYRLAQLSKLFGSPAELCTPSTPSDLPACPQPKLKLSLSPTSCVSASQVALGRSRSF